MTVYLDVAVKARGFISAIRMMTFWRKLVLTLLGGVVMSACATTAPQGPQRPVPGATLPGPGQQPVIINPGPKQGEPEQPIDTPEPAVMRRGMTPAFMGGKNIKRVAILLPFSARSANLRAEAASMLQAAEMAIFDNDDDTILLMALDSKGTPTGASQATRKALDQGADIILGPILAGSVKAAGKAARKSGVPVVGFSTDTSVAGNGVYLLSFPPEAEVRRITKFAAAAGASKFAFLGPQSTYGKRVLNAYKANVRNLGGIMAGVETYVGKDISVMQAPAAKLANMFPSPAETAENPEFDDPYHVVLLPEGGTALRSLAPLLTFYNENTRHVQIMGTGLWNRDEAAQEPALAGGIFAGPDLAEKLVFNAKYDAVYGEEPSRLASLAYDGLSIASFVAAGDIKDRTDMLTDPAGFFGVDGLVRFTRFGTPERGLAVYQIKNGRFVVIDAAPKSTDGAF